MRNKFTLTRGDALVLVKAFASLRALVLASNPDAFENVGVYPALEVVNDLENFLTVDVQEEEECEYGDYGGGCDCPDCTGARDEEQEEEEEEEEEDPYDFELSADDLVNLGAITAHDPPGEKFKVSFEWGEDHEYLSLVSLDKDAHVIDVICEGITRVKRTGKTIEFVDQSGDFSLIVKKFPGEWIDLLPAGKTAKVEG